jgi:phosphatidate cytidylyltransferase
MLRWRLLLGILIVAALVGLCWLDAHASMPGIWLLPLVIVVTVLATQEMLDLLAIAGMRPLRWIVYLTNLFLVAFPWLHGIQSLEPPFTIDPIPHLATNMVAAVLVIFLAEMCRYRKPGGNMANIAASIFVVSYVGLMLAMAVAIRLTAGLGLVAAWIIVVKMGDTGAYAVGRLIGRHKMAPLISPGKTMEGAFGALAFSCLGAWLSLRFLVPVNASETIAQAPWWGWLAFGLLVGAAGMLGDLAESLLKRDVGVKDSSTWLPGFGGVLDMIDSLLLSAPVAWFCWALGMVGR